MRILKKTLRLLDSIFHPNKYDIRLALISKQTDHLQKLADDSLKKAQMNGEDKWFLRVKLEDKHKGAI